ncbi:MAG: hypothetical protein PHN56_00930, partial [Candidatus Nanoarchaeia archaeon]|nr:hypothetical protein [Candidatus Nanoarchaeia archaeon]
LIDLNILNEVEKVLTLEEKLSFEIIKSNLIKNDYDSSGFYYNSSYDLLKKMNYTVFNESYSFNESSEEFSMLVNVNMLKVSINNINNTKYEITRVITNNLNKTITNLVIYFELSNTSIVDSSINIKDSKAYFTINSLAPGESEIINYSFLSKSNEETLINSFGVLSHDVNTNPLTAFVTLARSNKEVTLYSLIGVIIISLISLIYILRNDLSNLSFFSKLKN